MTKTIPACRDCKHCMPNKSLPVRLFGHRYDFARCGSARAELDQRPRYHLGLPPEYSESDYCSVMRNHDWLCGPRAKLFEPKEEEEEQK